MPNKRSARDDVISLDSSSSDDDGPVPGPSSSPSKRNVPSSPARRRSRETRSVELDVPHALDDASRTQLHVAIATSSEERVREAFAALIDALPSVTERVFSMLVATRVDEEQQDEEVGPGSHGAGRPEPSLSPQPPRVRERAVIAPRWATCANCGEEYDTGTPRRPRECNYHRGGRDL
ncbi:hypothetical protein BN946_scf184804.g5 [Trametes cinnabarina]|uniref:C2H2-type domain-containing protein n=1 Tax=Pycnoporus cinnabarinus TaxID=5643 RepID=A0A060SER4_PYCCI|nr:hypothetical protein BN946_scf184804.g5 [Trametes cinnabarina]